MQNSRYMLFSDEEYERLESLLKTIAKKQETVFRNMFIASARSESTHQAVLDLLAAVKKRVADKDE